MSIRIGASCVGRWGYFTKECAVAEIRFLRGNFYPGYDYHPRADEALAKCRQYNIYPIVSIGFYQEGTESWRPSEAEYRHCTEELVKKLYSYGFNKNTARITCENEPMKNLTKEEYEWYINLTYDQVRGRFYVGAGNEEFSLAYHRGNMYEYLLQRKAQGKCNFDILDIHIQSSCNTESKLAYWGNWIKNIKAKYSVKRISCTEANWMDIATSDGYNLLLKQLRLAEDLGCEDFCIVFVELNGKQEYTYERLAFIRNGKVRSPFWTDFVRIINEKKPKRTFVIGKGDDDMKLYLLKKGVKGNFVKWLQEILEVEYGFENEGGYDGIFGVLTENQVKAYQSANRLTVDGIVGMETTTALINNAEDPDKWMRKLQIYMGFESK